MNVNQIILFSITALCVFMAIHLALKRRSFKKVSKLPVKIQCVNKNDNLGYRLFTYYELQSKDGRNRLGLTHHSLDNATKHLEELNEKYAELRGELDIVKVTKHEKVVLCGFKKNIINTNKS